MERRDFLRGLLIVPAGYAMPSLALLDDGAPPAESLFQIGLASEGLIDPAEWPLMDVRCQTTQQVFADNLQARVDLYAQVADDPVDYAAFLGVLLPGRDGSALVMPSVPTPPKPFRLFGVGSGLALCGQQAQIAFRAYDAFTSGIVFWRMGPSVEATIHHLGQER